MGQRDDEILDFGEYPEINCSAVGDMQLIPDGRVRWVLVDWHRYQGIWRRKLAGLVTMPTSAVPPRHLEHWSREFEQHQSVPLVIEELH